MGRLLGWGVAWDGCADWVLRGTAVGMACCVGRLWGWGVAWDGCVSERVAAPACTALKVPRKSATWLAKPLGSVSTLSK